MALRTWNPAKKEFDYTAAGRSFYERRPRQYIVQVPVRVYVKRRSGDESSYTGTYPAADFSEEIRDKLKGVVGSDATAQRRIKEMVLAHLGNNGTYRGQKIVAEFSDQIIVYLEGGEWSFAFMETRFDAAGNASTTAAMQRPLRGWRFPIKDAETALEEAYEEEDERNCVIKQLEALYQIPYDEIEREIGSTAEGVSAEQALEWCKMKSFS